MADKKNIAGLSFEAALQELEGIVSTLEKGDAPLETSIELYERGAVLKAHCEKKLKDAKEKVDKIMLSETGEVRTEPASFE
ncbi:exodeoxyribonuclease VII small subunit [Aquisalinus flavus]|uniref:Exodeoxyribonuclease 7 small subunit n=1 Tax=Aquisalinus flavus TaxID=1526572 RepID=A0A8J2Y7A4_9PROT|nr:exodeoxyribonuclease VII small subunit [Aquisalinus flavus]MBD0427233.1 exodeoxyribonuclease VII small subunit [Aquisalinus flavus]UNE47048.1 exodeoxyribonuclease VII small subunit [Aquisalinus flavus]GGC99377.1 exodeoxyribonuclease 7 small subunit [Aquisalinus flavus]